MELNENKFEFMNHGYNFDPVFSELPYSHYRSCYKTLNNTLIESSTLIKDLGITFSSDSSFSTHISNIAKKATNKAAWILSVFSTRNQYEMLFLYKTYVRPNLEYCCPLWNPSGPNSVGQIQTLEAVQRSFTSKITSLQDCDYWERLKRLNLMSLQRRRERYIIIYVWKIITGKAPNDVQMEFYMCSRGSIKAKVPGIPNCRNNTSKYDKSFAVIGTKLWNLLPAKCSNLLHSLEKFKQLLGEFLDQYPDTPPVHGYFSPHTNSLIDPALSQNNIVGN